MVLSWILNCAGEAAVNPAKDANVTRKTRTLRQSFRQFNSDIPGWPQGSRVSRDLRVFRGIDALFLSTILVFLSVCFIQNLAASSALKQYAAAFHVHSRISNGAYEISELARLSSDRKIEVLVLTDSFLTTVTYGVWPLERIAITGINKSYRPAVRDYGVKDYFAAIRRAEEQWPQLTIVPGVEVTPFYYWKGKPWGELTLYNFDRHLLVLGLDEEATENLPVIENANWKNTDRDWKRIATPLVFLLCGALLSLRRKKRLSFAGVFLIFFGLLVAWSSYPFGKLSDPYAGRADLRPYQSLIDYVRENEGLTYWSYPEARYRDVLTGGARMVSAPHPEDLLATDGYTGFEGLYGDRIEATHPGKTWDEALMQYLWGQRKTPPYVTSGIDFHYFKGPNGGWYELDGGQTILLMPSRSDHAVLEALRKGHNYALFQQSKQKFRLLDFTLETSDGMSGTHGDSIRGRSPVKIQIHLDWLNGAPSSSEPFALELIRNGEVVERWRESLPLRLTVVHQLAPGKYYFRLQAASANAYRLLSNPIFLTVH